MRNSRATKIALIATIAVLIIAVLTVAAIGATGGFGTELSPIPTPTPTPIPTPTPTPTPIPSTDSDGDGMRDWFEVNIANLDPLIENDRYLLHIDGQNAVPGRLALLPSNPIDLSRVEVGDYDEYRYILKQNKFKPDNITQLWYSEATKANFENAVTEIISKVDSNDIVYIQFVGHGSKNGILFYDQFTDYSTIDSILDNIQAKMVVLAIFACKSGLPETLEPVSSGPCPRIVMAPYMLLNPTFHSNDGPLYQQLTVELSKADSTGDRNGFPSIKEMWINDRETDLQNNIKVAPKQGYDYNPWSSTVDQGDGGTLHYEKCHTTRGCWNYIFYDLDNIGAVTYLGDASLEDLTGSGYK